MKYQMVTEQEYIELESEFFRWFGTRDSGSKLQSIFGHARGVCKTIVIEYIANQQGKTTYQVIADERNEK